MTTISVHAIHNDRDYRSAMERINELAKNDPKEGSGDFDELKVWALIVRAYEDEHVPLEAPSIKDVVEFRAEQMGLQASDLDAIFGGSGRRSEVLSGKRALSKSMAARLRALGVPDSVLLQLLLETEAAPASAGSKGSRSFSIGRDAKTGNFIPVRSKQKPKRRASHKRAVR